MSALARVAEVDDGALRSGVGATCDAAAFGTGEGVAAMGTATAEVVAEISGEAATAEAGAPA